jgi:hypothetical protein
MFVLPANTADDLILSPDLPTNSFSCSFLRVDTQRVLEVVNFPWNIPRSTEISRFDDDERHKFTAALFQDFFLLPRREISIQSTSDLSSFNRKTSEVL